jgi:N-methylhydantoinase A
VGGAIAALELGRLADRADVLAFDMGGTTAKACIAGDGRLPVTRAYEVDRVHRFKGGSGTPLPVPTVDLIEIGAGGGSIAAIDGLGMIKVGPHSAGADPGPICYGRGGTRPTITDCNLVLGYLAPEGFLGGAMRLARAPAEAGILEVIGAPLGLDSVQAAHGVIEVVNENMAAAIRMYAAERGGNLAASTMVAFGGAGPLHADGVARKLGIKEILVPRAAGVFSALGFLASPVSYEVARSALTRLESADPDRIEALFGELEASAAAVVRQAAPDGAIRFERIADMSYHGQGHELRIVLARDHFDPEDAAQRFMAAYRDAYGYAYDDMEAQIVTVRVIASVTGELAPVATPAAACPPDPGRVREAYDPATSTFVDHDVFTMERLAPGQAIAGPAIIEDRGSTVRIGQGALASFRPEGWLQIEITP